MAPYIDQNGRTQVPVRYLGDVLNMSALWQPANQSVLLTRNDRNTLVSLTIGSDKLDITDLVNSEVTMDTTPVIVPPGRTMLPARFVAQAVGYQVSWNAANQTVTVTPPSQSTPTGPVQGIGSGNDGGVGTGTGGNPVDTNNAVEPGGHWAGLAP